MLMLEHEGKLILREAGLPVPTGIVLTASDDGAAALARSGVPAGPVAVKAQVRSGGRGKAGGVIRADSPAEAAEAARALFALHFGDEAPEAVLIEPWQAIKREIYLSVTVDGPAGGYVVLYAARGGVDIEDGPPPVRYAFGQASKFRAWRFREAILDAEADGAVREKVVTLAERLVRLAAARDCTTIEINPLAELEDGSLLPLDAKVVRDDWAHFRQEDIRLAHEDEKARADELVRACLDMNHMYVPLDGDVALISGGAGMTMGAMDMIRAFGGRPACFLDCSPGPTSTRGYRPAFAMLDADPKVKVILVSVFGGGTHMDRVAGAMRDILRERASAKPVVFRLNGTHVDQVDGLLAEVDAINHADLESAVREAVALAGSERGA